MRKGKQQCKLGGSEEQNEWQLERREGYRKIRRGRLASLVSKYLAELYQLLILFYLNIFVITNERPR